MEPIKAWISRLATALGSLTRRKSTQEITAARPPRDFAQEREADRSGQMSPDDQAWESETRQRDQSSQKRKQSKPQAD